MSFLASLPAITLLFLGIIFILTSYWHFQFTNKVQVYGPTILTTFGIFATFLGIALGLKDFNVGNIQASIPDLLAGLKTAFWASVAGVGGALTLKFRQFFFNEERTIGHTEKPEEITSTDLLKSLRGIQQAIAGSHESSLVSQLKLIRKDTNERLDTIKNIQLEALRKISEMGSKPLIETLQEVIKDFNSKLTEQFGDNFKELNNAVGKLLVWQSQYKTHIETMTQHHLKIIQSMDVASENYQKLVSEAERFSVVSNDLSRLLSALETQKQGLNGMLKSLADLLESASGNLPEIEKKILALTNQLAQSVIANQKEVSTALTENIRLIRSSAEDIGKNYSRINQELNSHVSEMAEKTKQQITVLDAALTEELQKSLESLGRQLAALSEKFVSDYEPLTEKLREVVHLARQAS